MGGQTGPVFYIYYEGMRHPPPYAEDAQLSVRAFRRHKETGQAKGV